MAFRGERVAGRISSGDIEALRERADLASVIGDYTGLKRAGTRYKGLCPLHEERTPSFTVDPARGLWHCFGCGEGGDAYKFLEKVEALTFPEAVERLARLTGYELTYEDMSPGQRKALGRRTRLTDLVGEAARFFHQHLFTDDGSAARTYLKQRGLDREAAEHFQLGWAPDRWDGLVRHLTNAGFGQAELVDAGVATRGQRGLLDRFRGRLIFPIFDASGRDVLGFGGRVLPDRPPTTAPRDGEPPKYINSPESEIYVKSKVLYGLNWARAEAQRRDTVLVVEGYMDVIALHRADVRNAVATCGTALTAEHFRQLEKFARRVVLALDADDAGFAAADRARALAEEAGVREVAVLPLPPGEDPADLAASGAERVEEALADVRTAIEFQITHLLRTANTSTPEGQVEAYRRTFPLLARIGDRVLRYRYIRDIVAPVVKLSADRIEAELDAADQEPSSSTAVEVAAAPRPSEPRDPQLRLERQVLQLALQRPDLLPPSWSKVGEHDFTSPASRQLFVALAAAPSGGLDDVLEALPDEDTRRRVRALALADLPTSDSAHAAQVIDALRRAAIDREMAEVRARMDTQREQLSTDERRSLAARIEELRRRRDAIRDGHEGG
ncbi:DNA primase [Egibacter rhizosphaerae]|uniref:DNA primase n=1 Tax=Egibacter rhizosphaerae TaxID=1670831 RepID=UPI0013F1752F|nr:DNA primase [Egibacter rhizosphaerae]